MNDKPLFTVIIVALSCMMAIQIFGVYFNALFPKENAEIIYECNFNMGKSILTRPCTIHGVWNE